MCSGRYTQDELDEGRQRGGCIDFRVLSHPSHTAIRAVYSAWSGPLLTAAAKQKRKAGPTLCSGRKRMTKKKKKSYPREALSSQIKS